MSDRKFTTTHGGRTSTGASRTDVRAAKAHGRGEVQGKRHPWLPVLFGSILPSEWTWHAAEERGARSASALLSARWWTIMVLLSGAGLLVWTSGPSSVRWVAMVLWGSVLMSALNA